MPRREAVPHIFCPSLEIDEAAKILHTEDLSLSLWSCVQLLEGRCKLPILKNCWESHHGHLVAIAIRYMGELGARGHKSIYGPKLMPYFPKRDKSGLMPDFVTPEMVDSHRANLMRLAATQSGEEGGQERFEWYAARLVRESEMSKQKLRTIQYIWPAHARRVED